MSDAQTDTYNGYEPSNSDTLIGHYRLIRTSTACPEQYDVFDDRTKQQVGYLRLRHGYFHADLDDCGGAIVYEADTLGDGMFDDEERMPQLTAAVSALEAAILARAQKNI